MTLTVGPVLSDLEVRAIEDPEPGQILNRDTGCRRGGGQGSASVGRESVQAVKPRMQ